MLYSFLKISWISCLEKWKLIIKKPFFLFYCGIFCEKCVKVWFGSKHSKLICFTYSAIVLIIQLSDQAYFVNADWFSTIFVLSAQLSPRLGFFLSGIRLGSAYCSPAWFWRSRAACGLEKMAQNTHINGAIFFLRILSLAEFRQKKSRFLCKTGIFLPKFAGNLKFLLRKTLECPNEVHYALNCGVCKYVLRQLYEK